MGAAGAQYLRLGALFILIKELVMQLNSVMKNNVSGSFMGALA